MCTLCTKCTSDSGPKWRFRTRKQLQSFAFYAPIWPLFPSCLYRKNGSLYIYTFVCLTQFSTKYIYIQSRIYACNFLSLWKYKTPRRWEGLIFFPLKILKRRRTAANFSLNKDGGVFNALKINESQQTGVENYESMSHVPTFVWSWNENSQILTRIRCPSNDRHS